MYFGEDIEVKGSASPRLAYQLREYQHILNSRFPKILNRVNVTYHQLEPSNKKPKFNGTTFSGGVDSLFTVWNHLPMNLSNPEYQLTHVVFIKGFDILHSARHHYQTLLERFHPWVEKYKLELVPLETNIVSITHKRLDLSYFYGPHIVSGALVLSGLFKHFYIPSSWDYANLRKKAFTSDPLLDPLLSTETIDIIHHGAAYPRVVKLKEIADWELAQNLLWVCQEHKFDRPAWNCSRCDKCMRTMIPLYALGKLGEFKTFERPFQEHRDGLRWARKFSLRHNFYREMYPFMKKHRQDFLPFLCAAIVLGFFRSFIVVKMPGFARKWLRRFGFYVTRNEAADAYELAEINSTIQQTL
jgi:hypothetical protein